MSKKYKYHYLYKIERLDTGEYYIGIRSCDVDPIDDNYWGSGVKISAKITKHGIDSFTKTILAVFLSRRDAANAEREMVTEDLLFDPLCLNLKTGGEYENGVTYSDDACKKISTSLKQYYSDPAVRKAHADKIKQAYLDNPEYIDRIKKMRQRVLNDPAHRAKIKEIVRKSFMETDRAERIKNAVNKPEAKAKKSKSIKAYANTPEGKIARSFAAKNKIWVTKDEKTARINKDELPVYLNDGWVEGFKLNIGDNTRKKLGDATRGKKFMVHTLTGKITRVLPDNIEEYQNNGWKLGTKQ